MGAWKTGLFLAVGLYLWHFSIVNAQCNNGDIRLVGGSTPYKGRVEVCASLAWGTVCDDLWTDADASVVCRQLGFSGLYARGFSNAFFGQGAGPILMDNVDCSGSETNITSCSFTTTHNCEHTEDAGVQCNPTPVCPENAARLRGGNTQTQGRVEVCILETWQTVCSTRWDNTDASVACRQLGFSGFSANILGAGAFTSGSGPIWANNINCAGSETTLSECSKSLDTSSCTHSNDAGVSCSPNLLCNNGDLRLMGSSRPNEGRLELCWNEMWGTVCNNSWSVDVASVACRQLGFSANGAYGFGFGGGTGAILLSNINCNGNESRLVDCMSDGLGVSSNCLGHQDDAGVVCLESCPNGAIRFVNGQNPWEGRVEVCRNQVWGTVCSDFWSQEDANVACRQAGFSGFGATALTNAPFGQGQGPIHLDDLTCQGGERSLFDCDSSTTPNCAHAQDAGARCSPNPICGDGDVRLVGGAGDREGRVEVCFNETWGTVCDTFWSSSDGSVACAQAGYSRLGAQTFTDAHFGQGSGPIYLGDVQCSGDETRLIDCNHGGIGGYDTCSHSDDAGVSCQLQTCSNGALRLIGGSNVREGRVEMCYSEQWGTICDDSFDSTDASVICSQLGFSRDGSQTARFGQGAGPIFLNDLQCAGTESSLLQCPYTGIGVLTCTHTQDAGVRCQPKSTLPTNVRVIAVANTTINVQWGAPQDFQSRIMRYRVNCSSSGSASSQQTLNNVTFSLTFNSLNPYTNYTCCVEALFTDPRENAFTCDSTFTLQGLPGRATNLRATPSQVDCNSVLLEWDPPAEDERNGIVSQYRVGITGSNSFDQNFSPNVNSLTVTLPTCCAGYSYTVQAFTVGYGPSSTSLAFRTFPDLTTPIIVEVTVTGVEQISITWVIPQSVTDQGLTGSQITVTPQCFNRQPMGDSQSFTYTPDSLQVQMVTNLMPNVPYRVLMTARVCDADVPAYDEIIYISEPELPSPTINAVIRTGPSTALVQFDVQTSDPPFDFFEVSYYVSDGSTTLDPSALVNTISIGEAVQQRLQDLETCTQYWVVVNAVNCPARTSSEPKMLGLSDTIPFELVVSLGNVGTCDSWIVTNQGAKINDVENAVIGALIASSCGLDASCVYNSMWSCSSDDQSKVTYRTTLVGTDRSSAQQQLSCLQEWGSVDGTINVGSTQLQRQVPVIAPVTPTATSSSGTPPYVWVIVVFVILFAVIAIIAIVALVLLAVKRPDKTGPVPHEKMIEDDAYETQSTRSIGIVENPLYAEPEEIMEMPTYSTLSAKEMEADAEFMKDVDFDSPDTDSF